MDRKKPSTKLMELRSECFAEGEKFVQITYLCGMDDSSDIGGMMLDKIGGIHAIGMATVGRFMKLGILPVSLLYEKEGRVVRSMENTLEGLGFAKMYGNIYRPSGTNDSLSCRVMKKKAA